MKRFTEKRLIAFTPEMASEMKEIAAEMEKGVNGVFTPSDLIRLAVQEFLERRPSLAGSWNDPLANAMDWRKNA